MKKTLPVDMLLIGMKVVGLDKSWIETSFLSHTFTIRSEKDIEKLQRNGVRTVTVEIEDPPAAVPKKTDDASLDPSPGSRPIVLAELPETAPGKIRHIQSLREETIHLLTRSFQQARIQSIIPSQEIRSHVRETVTFLLQNPSAINLLSDIHDNDDETYVHSANTMLLAAGFAIRHQMQESECVQWGLAALLHDIGKIKIPDSILKKPGPLDLAEWEIMRQHPVFGFQILRKSPDSDIHGLPAQVAVEHHERQNGTGYPHRIGLDLVHPVSRSLMVLDIFEALTANRVYRSRVSHQKVIHYLINEYADRVSVPVILELASMVGIFPVGTFLETEDGEIWMILGYEDIEKYEGKVTILDLFGPGRKLRDRPKKRTLPRINPESIARTHDYRSLGLNQEHWESLLKGTRESP